MFEEKKNPRERSKDRILVLEEIEPGSVKSSSGNLDNRLFKGGNRVHAVMDPATCFWKIKYEQGNAPEALNKTFTRFNLLLDTAKNYYNKRGLRIKEILD